MVITVVGQKSGNMGKAQIRAKLKTIYNVKSDQLISLFGFRTKFGGAKTSGFALIYDNLDAVRKFEPKHRLVRLGLKQARQDHSRKAIKERKTKLKKLRGTAKAAPA